MTKTEKIYLASVLDFSGSILFINRKGSLPYPLVRISSRDIDRMKHLSGLMGARLHINKHCHLALLSYSPAQTLVRGLMPWLRWSVDVSKKIDAWAPTPRGPKKSTKVPCPKCGNPMTPVSKTCAGCFREVTAAGRLITPKNFLAEPQKLQQNESFTRTGLTTKTAAGQIHRMRG